MNTPVTLKAIHLGEPEPRSDAWYELRRGGITATDLPQILGLSQYGNARKVYYEKRGILPNDVHGPSEAGRWGHLLEDVVAQEWATRNNLTVSTVGVLANLYDPWQRASCDRLIDGRNAALEVKTRSAFTAGRWRDDMPDDVLAQVAWQRMVGQFDYIDVACLIGGQKLETYRYEQDQDLERFLRVKAAEVWNAVIDDRVPPPDVNMDSVLIDLLDQLYPNRTGIVEVPASEALALVNAYLYASKQVKDAETLKEAAQAQIIATMGPAEILTVTNDTAPVFTYKAQERSSVSLKDLEDNDVELYEKVLAGGHITTTTSRTLRAGKGAKNVTP
jgi:putative phage-type endonuclease